MPQLPPLAKRRGKGGPEVVVGCYVGEHSAGSVPGFHKEPPWVLPGQFGGEIYEFGSSVRDS